MDWFLKNRADKIKRQLLEKGLPPLEFGIIEDVIDNGEKIRPTHLDGLLEGQGGREREAEEWHMNGKIKWKNGRAKK